MCCTNLFRYKILTYPFPSFFYFLLSTKNLAAQGEPLDSTILTVSSNQNHAAILLHESSRSCEICLSSLVSRLVLNRHTRRICHSCRLITLIDSQFLGLISRLVHLIKENQHLSNLFKIPDSWDILHTGHDCSSLCTWLFGSRTQGIERRSPACLQISA